MSFDFTKMMKMAGDLQKVMSEQGKELESKIYEGEAGGGLVKVTVNGRAELVSIKIDPILTTSKDLEMIQDLTVAAANNALAQAKAGTGHDIASLMQRFTSTGDIEGDGH